MSQFKQGDLALIVGANSMVQNIGKACELLQFVTMQEFYVTPNGVTYQHDDVPCWVVSGDGLCSWFDDGSIEQSDWGLCEPRHLRPLNGVPEPATGNYTKLRRGEPA